MGYQILSFLLDVATGLLGGACLLRLYMQRQRVPFGNPVGRFVFALTDWIVLPLRKVLPPVARWDTASVVAAYLVELVQYAILALTTFAVDIVVMSGYTAAAARVMRAMRDPAKLRWVNRGLGGAFVAAGVALATFRRAAPAAA